MVVTFVVVGAGNRGKVYSRYALEHPELARCVGVAEPRDYSRDLMVKNHKLPLGAVFQTWEAMALQPKMADAAVICTQDQQHEAPALAFAKLGYHILLEKPLSPTAESCKAICRAVDEAGVILAIGHVMRYTPYSRKIKALLDAGAIGRLISVQHLEPIGFWHFAHSYVRGNWRNEALSSSMLLAKACHDVDWLRWIVGEPCSQVSSFGSLQHFRADQKPAGAAARCLDCSAEASCPYSAKKIYLDPLERGHKSFPVDRIIDAEPTIENIHEALRTGPYGRCVFGGCDNDVVDQQVANFEFASGVTASLSVIAFTEEICVRKTRIFGTLGQIDGDGASVKVFSFLSGKTETFHPDHDARPNTQMTGHGCGDYWLMKSFVESVAAGDPSKVASGPRESLESHLMVFAAEEARKQRRVVSMQPQAGTAPKSVAPTAP